MKNLSEIGLCSRNANKHFFQFKTIISYCYTTIMGILTNKSNVVVLNNPRLIAVIKTIWLKKRKRYQCFVVCFLRCYFFLSFISLVYYSKTESLCYRLHFNRMCSNFIRFRFEWTSKFLSVWGDLRTVLTTHSVSFFFFFSSGGSIKS